MFKFLKPKLKKLNTNCIPINTKRWLSQVSNQKNKAKARKVSIQRYLRILRRLSKLLKQLSKNQMQPSIKSKIKVQKIWTKLMSLNLLRRKFLRQNLLKNHKLLKIIKLVKITQPTRTRNKFLTQSHKNRRARNQNPRSRT